MRRTLVRRLLAVSLVAPLAFALGACGDDDDTPPPPPADLGPADAGTDLGTDLGARDAGVDAGPAGCTTGCAIEEITSGLFHSCARRENGEVLCWGNNFFRELGDGSGRHLSCPPLFNELPTDCQARPVAVSDLEGATEIEAHNGPTTCARIADGSWKCWGLEFINTGTGQPEELSVATAVPRLDGVVQLGPAFGSACGVTTTGGVSCFGSNQEGQLGDGTTTERRTPVAVSGLTGVAEVRSSGNHTCARLTDGGVRCWGSNESGQLGDGVATHGTTCRRGSTDIDCVTAPVTVATIDDATGLAVTGQSTCALRGDGTVWCWGANYFGQLGNGTLTDSNTPVQVSELTGATAVAAGGSHFCALVAGGAVKCWGLNFDAQLGDNATHELCVFASDSEDCSKVPVNVVGLTGVTQLALGASHSCALTATGVSCWGDNVVYQSGTRASMRVTTPTAVAGIP
jgi:alpha-tubulin suppressor-like RCC1 family protein